MTRSRLAVVDDDLARLIDGASLRTCRLIAAEVATLAATATDIQEKWISPVRETSESGALGGLENRVGLNSLVLELDELAWDLQEQGSAAEASYLLAFRKARAASALLFALEDDARIAALEAAYEAQSAMDDLGVVQAVARRILADT